MFVLAQFPTKLRGTYLSGISVQLLNTKVNIPMRGIQLMQASNALTEHPQYREGNVQ